MSEYGKLEPFRRSKYRRYKVQLIRHFLRNNTKQTRTTYEGEDYVYDNFPQEHRAINTDSDCIGTCTRYYPFPTRIDTIIITDLLKWNTVEDKPRLE